VYGSAPNQQNQPQQGRGLQVHQSPSSTSVKITRADIVREASRRVPLNQLGLPEGFHRSDLLHTDCVKKVLTQDELMRSPNDPHIDLSRGILTDEGPLLILDERLIRLAYVPLDYRENFPTLPNSGQPFWAQLDFEPTEAFKAFEAYLKQGTDEGARRLFALACIPSIQALTGASLPPYPNGNGNGYDYRPATPSSYRGGPRPVYDPGQVPGREGRREGQGQAQEGAYGPQGARPAPQAGSSHGPTSAHAPTTEDREYERSRELALQANRQLQEWHTIYYWGPRSRSHDLFYLDGIRQGQVMRALHLQNDHFRDATKLYNDVLAFIHGEVDGSTTEDGVPRFWAEMSPRVLVDFMKVLSQMQRLSLGLPAAQTPNIDSPSNVINILRSLVGAGVEGGAPSGGRLGAAFLSGLGSNTSAGSRGRPRTAYDENNNLISQSQSTGSSTAASQTLSASHGSAGSQGMPGDISDEDRVRRISMLFNTAKARREANRPNPQAASPDPEPDPRPDPEPEQRELELELTPAPDEQEYPDAPR